MQSSLIHMASKSKYTWRSFEENMPAAGGAPSTSNYRCLTGDASRPTSTGDDGSSAVQQHKVWHGRLALWSLKVQFWQLTDSKWLMVTLQRSWTIPLDNKDEVRSISECKTSQKRAIRKMSLLLEISNSDLQAPIPVPAAGTSSMFYDD